MWILFPTLYTAIPVHHLELELKAKILFPLKKSDIRGMWYERVHCSLPLNNLNKYNSMMSSLFNIPGSLRVSTHWNFWRWISENKQNWWIGRKAKRNKKCSPGSGNSWLVLSWGGGKCSCGWHSFQPGGAERFIGHSCRNGQYKLWLSPESWARILL